MINGEEHYFLNNSKGGTWKSVHESEYSYKERVWSSWYIKNRNSDLSPPTEQEKRAAGILDSRNIDRSLDITGDERLRKIILDQNDERFLSNYYKRLEILNKLLERFKHDSDCKLSNIDREHFNNLIADTKANIDKHTRIFDEIHAYRSKPLTPRDFELYRQVETCRELEKRALEAAEERRLEILRRKGIEGAEANKGKNVSHEEFMRERWERFRVVPKMTSAQIRKLKAAFKNSNNPPKDGGGPSGSSGPSGSGEASGSGGGGFLRVIHGDFLNLLVKILKWMLEVGKGMSQIEHYL
jgi:hypothetical protein